MSWTEIEADKLLEPPLVLKDFVKAVKNSRPTVSHEDLEKNAEWTEQFGSEGQ
jgi:vacuolar protein-sorting-associated protein 4